MAKKIWKLLCSRLFVVGVAVILQCMLLFVMIYYLASSYVYFQIAQALLGLAVFLVVINQKENPEHKIVWIFLIMEIPVVGVTLYCVLSPSKPSRKFIRQYQTVIRPSWQDIDRTEVQSAAGEYGGQVRYLEETMRMPAGLHTATRYLPDGSSFFDSLMADLRTAEKYIFLEYFIINPGRMWDTIHDELLRKVHMGVDVRLIFDDIGSVTYVSKDYAEKLNEEGIRCVRFNKLAPIISSYHNHRDHRKIAVIDGRVGYTGGINLSDEYINETHPFGYWKDNAIRLSGDAVDALTVLFLQNYCAQTRSNEDISSYLCPIPQKEPRDGVVMPFGTGPKPLYEESVAQNMLLNLIGGAKKSVWISTPYLVMDYTLSTALCNAVGRGVDVRIVIPGTPDKHLVYALTRNNACDLRACGVRIFRYDPGFNHAKTILVDGEAVCVSTINFDFRSLIHHFECGVWMAHTSCIPAIETDFLDIFAASTEFTEKELHERLPVALFVSFAKIFQSLL